ncbi:MAG: hypothetical protein ACOX4H_05020 [Bacillota bacterium]|jgi:hypothetical protein
MEELKQKWYEEFRAVLACKNAFMQNAALSHSYYDHKLPEFLKEIIQVVCSGFAGHAERFYNKE